MAAFRGGFVELLWTAGLVSALVAWPIHAQDAQSAASNGAAAQTSGATSDANAPASGGALEEIVVTAQRRTDTAQRTSLSLQVLGAQQLGNAGVTQAVDLTTLVPGLQVAHAAASTQIYIRGVGNFGATSVSNPAVAFNVDGVYVGRNEGVAGAFYDVARIEVLKGPQGTLYGRNAAGGAINLILQSTQLRSAWRGAEHRGWQLRPGEDARGDQRSRGRQVRRTRRVSGRRPGWLHQQRTG